MFFLLPSGKRPNAFTLIELLIVVAIIAILAAIAVPNYLEAQTRAKVSRAKADMRTVALAVELYTTDHNSPNSDTGNGAPVSGVPQWRPYAGGAKQADPPASFSLGYELTTPISYLTSLSAMYDPFRTARKSIQPASYKGREMLSFVSWRYREKLSGTSFGSAINRDGFWTLWSAGPDTYLNNIPGGGDYSSLNIPRNIPYDPTNGTVSNGDVYRSHKHGDGVTIRLVP